MIIWPTLHQKLERDCDSWNSWEKQAFLWMTCYTITSQSVVRPVHEYACPCWHFSLSKEQTKQLEDLQRHALQIISGKHAVRRSTLYKQHSASSRMSTWTLQNIFQSIIKRQIAVLWYLLPAKYDLQITAWLHLAGQYPTIYGSTNRYKNCLNHFQWHMICSMCVCVCVHVCVSMTLCANGCLIQFLAAKDQ